MNPQIIASYIAHSVTELLSHDQAAKPHTLNIWIKPNGMIEQSFESDWPSKNGVKLIGANVFSVELGLDHTAPDALEAFEEQDRHKMSKVIRAQTLQKIYDKALTNLAQRKAPELLTKAAMSQLNSVANVRTQIKQPGKNHAVH
jgi:hypothetical protein